MAASILRLLAALALCAALGSGLATADVSHKGWPKVTGLFWQAPLHSGGSKVGTDQNDELLGRHGSDVIHGGAGNDVIWGDSSPGGPESQHDELWGGPGNDWIYSSHGRKYMNGGPGDDHIIAYYGHGVIDCGPGDDIVQVRLGGAYKLHNCEHVRHFWGTGKNPNG